MEKAASIRTIKTLRNREEKVTMPSGQILRNDLVLLLRCIKDAEQQLGGVDHIELLHQRNLLVRSRDAMVRFASLLDAHLESMIVSPGKPEQGVMSHGH